jgi:hypothetical protein
MKPVPAKGIKGFLIVAINGDHLFRVYNKDHTFIDYKLYHNDLEIEIIDDDAFFYNIESKNILDYSPQTLGRENDF